MTGPGNCPAPTAVAEGLASLSASPGATRGSVVLDERSEGVALSLYDERGALLSERLLPNAGSCAERTEVAALVLAGWLSELPAQAGPSTPLPLPLPSPPNGVPAAPRTRFWSWEIAAAATGSAAAGTLAPGAALELGLGPARERWEIRVGGLYDGERQTSDGPGTVHWQRVQAALGGGYRLSRLPFALEVGGDVLLSELFLRGTGYASDGSSTSLDPGLDLTVRLALLRGHVHPWIGGWATFWLRPETPAIQGASLTYQLPEVAGFLGLGISWQSLERY